MTNNSSAKGFLPIFFLLGKGRTSKFDKCENDRRRTRECARQVTVSVQLEHTQVHNFFFICCYFGGKIEYYYIYYFGS